MKRAISLIVNGRSIESIIEPRTHLADFVREALRLTGTHLGCEHGVCGACTVLIDGAPMRSCIAYAVACEGAEVRTIEGFDDDPLMQTLRHAFARHHALQCGFCTPGMLITAYDIIQRLPGADEIRVREELAGNLCRCTGYVGIVEAILSVLAETPMIHSAVEGETAATLRTAPRSDSRSAPHDALPVIDAPPAAQNESDPLQSVRAIPFTPPFALAPTPSERRTVAALDDSGSEHGIALPIALDTLWPTLRDINTIVRCIPGASLGGPADADPLPLRMTVAIGPIRAQFEGMVRVTFDDRQRTGTIVGKGYDSRTRSSSEGRIEFSAEPSPAGGSVLSISLRYTLKGPLAQFSRGAIVDAVVEQLLERFAANLASTTEGRDANFSPPLKGLGLVVTAFRRRLWRWLTSSER